jgi:hypothetical protein
MNFLIPKIFLFLMTQSLQSTLSGIASIHQTSAVCLHQRSQNPLLLFLIIMRPSLLMDPGLIHMIIDMSSGLLLDQ